MEYKYKIEQNGKTVYTNDYDFVMKFLAVQKAPKPIVEAPKKEAKKAVKKMKAILSTITERGNAYIVPMKNTQTVVGKETVEKTMLAVEKLYKETGQPMEISDIADAVSLSSSTISLAVRVLDEYQHKIQRIPMGKKKKVVMPVTVPQPPTTT